MTSLTHKASIDADPDLVIDYTNDIENRLVEEKETTGGTLDERFVWDGGKPSRSV